MLIKKNGFTLTEVLVAMVMVGMMAGFALPSYFSSMEEARSNEAKTNLYIIYTAEKIYALSHSGDYLGFSGNPTVAALNSSVSGLSIDIAEQYYDVNSVTTPTSSTFSATATRNGTSGGGTTRAYNITQAGVVTQTGT